jgi:glyoxylate reductase
MLKSTKMERLVMLVTTARGAVIDEVTLAAALHEGQVSATGLAVFENEEIIDKERM